MQPITISNRLLKIIIIVVVAVVFVVIIIRSSVSRYNL